MKYTIIINQLAAHKLSSDLDIIDMAIFDFIKDFAPVAKRLASDNSYFMIRWKLITEQLPMLGISTRQGIHKRMQTLIDLDVIQAHPDNQTMNGSWFRWGKSYDKLIFSDRVNDGLQDATTVDTRVNDGLHLVSTTVDTRVNGGLHNKSTRDNSIKDKSIRKNTGLDYDLSKLTLPFATDEFLDAWSRWVELRNGTRKKLSTIAAAAQLKLLAKYDSHVAVEIIETSINNQWQGLFDPKFRNNGKQQIPGGGTQTQFATRHAKYQQLDGNP